MTDRIEKPRRIGVEELVARWAWAELGSSRFAGSLRAHAAPQIVARFEAGDDFEALSVEDHAHLAQALRATRPASFVDTLGTGSGAQFEIADWSVGDLLSAYVLPELGGCSFVEFLARPPRLKDDGDEGARLDAIDPRVIALTIPFDSDYAIEGPIIALTRAERAMLFEGYLRAILWLRQPRRKLQVWVPVSGN